MKTQYIKWKDLTKVLKVGDAAYSSRFGEGIVFSVNTIENYPIVIQFKNTKESFTKFGFYTTSDIYPSMSNIPFNPLTDPFPMPKFEPIVGEVYAFFDYEDFKFGYVVMALIGKDNSTLPFTTNESVGFKYCLPIEEAHAKYLDFLNTKNSTNEKY